MLKLFKINTAILICMAFIFRILFVNLGLMANMNTNHHGVIKGHFASVIKKRKLTEYTNQSSKETYSIAEICEENLDEDEQLRLNPLDLIKTIISFFTVKFASNIQKFPPSFDLLSFNSTDRYLKLQVIRI